ncbi:hypothetical protein AAHC03_04655 [Spirometra sp. Aus1]
MSLKSQLKELATPISSAYAIDVVRRKSLVYEDPKVVDGLTCLHECSKAFEKLCQMDADLIQFRKTLFSASTLKIEMCNLLPAHKAKIDQQVSLFLFMMSPHVRSAETLWALEFQIHLNYVDQFLMFLLPYYETGLFAKCIQLLDFQQSASQWQWLQPYADRGVPVSRLNFLKLCRSQPTLVPFIATLLSDYAKMESSYSTNRIQTVSSFFVSTVTGLCDAGLSDSKMAKIVSALQGVIRQGLRASKLPSFQSAAILATARIAMKLRLNTSLVLDWIECILKHTRKGSEWESIRLINVLMRTQSLVTLPDKLSDLHQHLTNTLSPVERSILEAEESALLEGTDLNAVAAEGLQTSERVQKATLLIDSVANEEDPSIKPMHVVQVRKKPLELLSAERLSKINFTELFADDKVLLANINFLHGFLASEPRSLCIMRQFSEVCSCPPGSLPTNNEWLSEILQRTVLRSITADIDSISPLEIHKAKAALQLISLSVDSISPQDKSPKLQKYTAKKDATKRALNFAFPCLLVTLVHPVGQLRVKAYELVRRCTRLFTDGESATQPDFANVAQFLHDAQEIDMPDCLSNLLLGDSLWALYKNASNFVRAVFRLLCRQELVAHSFFSRCCWLAAIRLWQTDLLPALIQLPLPDTISQTAAPFGWSAVLQLIRETTFGDLHTACLNCLDAATLGALKCVEGTPTRPPASTAAEAVSLLMGVSPREAELLDVLLELAGQTTVNGTSNLLQVFSKLTMKTEHFAYCLAKLDAVRLRDSSKSLFARVAYARKSRRRGNNTQSESVDPTKLEYSRLKTLQTIFATINNDASRLQAETVPQTLIAASAAASLNSPGKPGAEPNRTPLSSAVSRLRSTSKRKSALGDVALRKTPTSRVAPSESNHDLVFPINSHLFACLSSETRFSNQPSRETDTESCSSDKDEEEECPTQPNSPILILSDEDSGTGVNASCDKNSLENPLLSPKTDTDTPDNVGSVRDQNSACVLEALACLTKLFAEVNRRHRTIAPAFKSRGSGEREHPLAPSVSVAASVDTIFHCLSVYKQSPTIQLQGVLCLIEVASLYPAVLCHNLITLVQLVSSSNQFLRLDDKHNLSLLGRLISIAVPALVRASGDCAEAAFRVLSLFIRGLTDLPANLPRRCLAVYVGLLRGLSRVATPVTLLPDGGGGDCQSTPKSPATPRRTTKQASLQSWLWVSALMFINVDWPSQETADLVFPLLIDLFNQFDVGTQVAAWYQCLDFFLQLTFSPASDPLSPAKRNSKRMRLQGPTSMKSPLHAVEESQGRINSKLVIKYLAPEETAEAASAIESTPLLPGSRKRPLKEADSKHQQLSSDHVWRLLAQASALFSSLLESSGHEKRREDHQDPQILSRTYGTVVRHVVSLMVEAASTGSGHSEQSTDESLVHPQAKQALHHLQSILVKLNTIISSSAFLESVSRLMSLHQTSLMRKALELLLAKLSSLTAGCPSATALLKLAPVQRRRFSTARPPTLDETLEGGLVTLAVQLSEPVTAGARLPTERSQIKLLLLRLSCLRELAQLLCNGYPAELLKMLDSFIERPLCWWLASSNSATTTHVASSAAEARSLICLFGVECIARLPAPLTSLGSESTGAVHRVQCLLRFAVDHASTACRLSTHPALLSESAEDYVVGKIHSREQHLQASLTLILGVLEFCAVNAVDPQASLLQRLRSSSPTRLDLTLLALAFRLTHLDLAAATVAKLDRSASALKQCSALVKRITLHLVRCPDSLGLLTLIKELFKGASVDSDMHLVSGGLDFLAQHSDFIRTSSASAAVDLDDAYAEPSENLPNAIETAYVANPSLIWRLLSFALQCRPCTMTVTTTDPIRLAACSASASLLASLNRDYRLQLLSAALRWTVSTVKTPRKKSDPDTSLKVPPVLTMLFRLESVFRVLERLSAIISPEAFTVLVKNANLINLFVSCLSLLSGQQKSKDVRKMARALELPDFVDSFGQLDYSRSEEHRQAAVDCLRATLACTAAWLQAEAKLSACLDTAGTDVVLALPSALVSSLRVGCSSSGTTELDAVASPPVTEVDLVPAVDAFLKAIGGDEALLRPFGSALCALCSGRSAALNSHWRTRLAALRLLKQTFDTLVESQDQISDLGVASCLVGDTLAALSEALEDDRPEVEAAANRLFADLEAVGATVSQT